MVAWHAEAEDNMHDGSRAALERRALLLTQLRTCSYIHTLNIVSTQSNSGPAVLCGSLNVIKERM